MGVVDGLDDGGSKGDVIDKVAVHDIEVEPVGTRLDGAGGFLSNAREIGGEQGGGDDAIGVGPILHDLILDGWGFF